LFLRVRFTPGNVQSPFGRHQGSSVVGRLRLVASAGGRRRESTLPVLRGVGRRQHVDCSPLGRAQRKIRSGTLRHDHVCICLPRQGNRGSPGQAGYIGWQTNALRLRDVGDHLGFFFACSASAFGANHIQQIRQRSEMRASPRCGHLLIARRWRASA